MSDTNTQKQEKEMSVDKSDRIVREITSLILRRQTAGGISSNEASRLERLHDANTFRKKGLAALEIYRENTPPDVIDKIKQEGFGAISAFKSNGFLCYIWRHPALLHLNGYIAIPESHPFHGLSCIGLHKCGEELCDQFPVEWTYNGQASPDGAWMVTDDLSMDPSPCDWIFGFDCAHGGDIVPGFRVWNYRSQTSKWKTYKDKSFVQARLVECAKIFADASSAVDRETARQTSNGRDR